MSKRKLSTLVGNSERNATMFHALHEKRQHEREVRQRRSQVVKSKLILQGKELFKKFQVKKVVLYGSVLESNMREASDIDILVDFLPPDIFFSFQCQLEELL